MLTPKCSITATALKHPTVRNKMMAAHRRAMGSSSVASFTTKKHIFYVGYTKTHGFCVIVERIGMPGHTFILPKDTIAASF